MNTTIAANNNTAWTWKLTTILLTVVLAILGATAGLEFYYERGSKRCCFRERVNFTAPGRRPDKGRSPGSTRTK
jgi:hypothetical protein